MRLSRKMRKKLGYLPVPKAGRQAGWSRPESYRRAACGDIPTERDGKYLWVPSEAWGKRLAQMRGAK